MEALDLLNGISDLFMSNKSVNAESPLLQFDKSNQKWKVLTGAILKSPVKEEIQFSLSVREDGVHSVFRC